MLAACAPQGGLPPELSSAHDAVFQEAAAEYDLPPELLPAISYTLTRFQMVDSAGEFDGRTPTFGLMAVTPEMSSDARVRTDPRENVQAAAAWLRARADLEGIERHELEAWRDVAADYAQLEHPEARTEFFRDLQALWGAKPIIGVLREAVSPDYDLGTWRASPNFNSRSGRTPLFVIIHTCEGGYSGCWSWQLNPSAQVSAHYTVKEDGSEVSQLVRETDRAWHVGAQYQCSRNNNVRCDLNGVSTNSISVGIEHGGWASQTSFPAGQTDASARLVCNITRRWGIPRDREHILSHAQLSPSDRTDPGANWPWNAFIQKVKDVCGDAPPSCDRTTGDFTFSCDGVQTGQTCVSMDEPGDPHSWGDNYFCSKRDLGLRWSNAGAVDGMDCINVHESSEPAAAAWADNFLCAPKQSPFVFSYSSAGPIAGRQCVHLNETADLANSWNDNYICFEARHEFTEAGFTFKADGAVAGQTCVNVDEPSDPDTWTDNFFCTTRTDVQMQWSFTGPISGLECANVAESAESQAANWADNFLCVTPESRVRFHWSSAGPVSGLPCVRWFDHAETSATWLDNWLCIETLPPIQEPEVGAGVVVVPEVDAGVPPAELPPAATELTKIEGVTGGCSVGAPGLFLGVLALLLRRRR
ncbi:MAG: N-acetylmuramoyl-L-alanine amidase [Archangium sp.]